MQVLTFFNIYFLFVYFLFHSILRFHYTVAVLFHAKITNKNVEMVKFQLNLVYSSFTKLYINFRFNFTNKSIVKFVLYSFVYFCSPTQKPFVGGSTV